ncbi:MAG TPA: CARDB domain-containing protein [archaeon]|nr:CARDB domain-containing protein [archaeon]
MKKMLVLMIILILGSVFAAAPDITQLNYNPSPAIPGTTITIFIQIENNENIIQENVVLEIKDEYPFTIKEENVKIIGDIQKYGKALAQFIVYVDPSAENTTYEIPITISTKNQPNGITSNYPIIISGKEPTLKITNISTEKLIPGEEKEITITIQNVGTSTAYDVITELQEDRTITASGAVVEREITPLGAATTYIEKIMPSETKTTTLKISVNRNATLKNYTLPVKISYRNSSGTRTTDTSYIGFKIAGEVKLDAAIKEITTTGNLTEATIELFNSGEGKAEYTMIEISGNGTIDKPKQFIGSIEPNDVDSIKTKLTSNEETKTITLKITYQDSDAKTKTKIIELTLPTQEKTAEEPNLIINLIILVIIIGIIWIGYKKLIKKK